MAPRYPTSTLFLFSSFTQSILYGMYTATLVSCIRWLSYEDKGWILRKKINWTILTVALFLFACLTAYISIFFRITLDVMFDRGPPSKILLDVLPMTEYMARMITDAIVVYRCWVVYGRSWRIVALPIVLWVSCLVALALIAESYTKTSPQVIFPTVFISCHIPNNIYGTTAIIYKIMRVANTSSYNSRRLRKTCRILIESGILYTVSGLLNLVFVADERLHNKSLYIGTFPDIFHFYITGITFNFIIIRIGQERANPRNEFVDSRFVAGGPKRLSTFNHCIPRTTKEGSSQFCDTAFEG